MLRGFPPDTRRRLSTVTALPDAGMYLQHRARHKCDVDASRRRTTASIAPSLSRDGQRRTVPKPPRTRRRPFRYAVAEVGPCVERLRAVKGILHITALVVAAMCP